MTSKHVADILRLATAAIPPMIWAQNLEPAIPARPSILSPSLVPAVGMNFTLQSVRAQEYRRIPLKVANDDDWQAIDRDQVSQVRKLMAAFRKPFKTEPDAKHGVPPSDEEKEDFMRFQQEHADKVMAIINHDHPMVRQDYEKRCWIFYSALRDVSKLGCIVTKETNLELGLGERLDLAVKELSEYPVLQYDLLDGKDIHKMAADPTASRKDKTKSLWVNFGKQKKRLEGEQAKEAERVATAGGASTSSAMQPAKGGRNRKAKGIGAIEEKRLTPDELAGYKKTLKEKKKEAAAASEDTEDEAEADGEDTMLKEMGDAEAKSSGKELLGTSTGGSNTVDHKEEGLALRSKPESSTEHDSDEDGGLRKRKSQLSDDGDVDFVADLDADARPGSEQNGKTRSKKVPKLSA